MNEIEKSIETQAYVLALTNQVAINALSELLLSDDQKKEFKALVKSKLIVLQNELSNINPNQTVSEMLKCIRIPASE